MASSLKKRLGACLAGLVLLAFLLCGEWGHRRAHCFYLDSAGPLGSSDRVLDDMFKVDHASARFLRALPDSEQPLALLVPGDYPVGPLVQMALSSLTWPRAIDLLIVRDGKVPTALSGGPGNPAYGACLLFCMAPPSFAGVGTRVGPLTILRAAP